jgi:hypothetical protein
MTLLPIPSAESATDPIGSPADLQQRWRALMGRLGFGERLLRFAFVGPDRRLVKVLSEVPIGAAPDPRLVETLMLGLGTLLYDFETGSTVALLLTRPGRGGVSETDRRWGAVLTQAAKRFDVPLEPVFRANDEAILLVTPRARPAS